MYSIEAVNKLKRKLTIARAIMYSLVGIVILVTSLCLVFMKEEHETAYKISLSIADTLFLLGVAFIAAFIIPSIKTEKRHIETILKCNEEFIDARVAAFKDGPITLSNGISVYEIELKVEERTRIVRLMISMNRDSLEMGSDYRFVLANNFVKEWRPL